jgi:hypothetical protein
MRQLGIPHDHPNILLVNGKQANPDTVLKDGETLAVFPPLAGGWVQRVAKSATAKTS